MASIPYQPGFSRDFPIYYFLISYIYLINRYLQVHFLIPSRRQRFNPCLKNLHLTHTFIIPTNFQSQCAFKSSGVPCSQPSPHHLNSNALLPKTQSAYRPHHSMETAVLRVVSDIRVALDVGHVSLLLLLDMSAAFDTVDHDILVARLDKTFAVHQTPLQWFSTYL